MIRHKARLCTDGQGLWIGAGTLITLNIKHSICVWLDFKVQMGASVAREAMAK